jgi:IS30 family transposase
MATERARDSHTRQRITQNQWQGVARLIRQDGGPEQIAARARFEETVAISHESIYRFSPPR